MVRIFNTLGRKQRPHGTGFGRSAEKANDETCDPENPEFTRASSSLRNKLARRFRQNSVSKYASKKKRSERYYSELSEESFSNEPRESILEQWCNEANKDEKSEREQIMNTILNSGARIVDDRIMAVKIRIECSWASELTSLPPGLHVDDLVIENGRKLKCLPSSLQVKNSLRIVDCDQLQNLPSRLKLRSLVIVSNKCMEKLPRDIKISSELELIGCTAIVELPPRLNLDSLSIIHGAKLEKLPKRMSVVGKLHLSDCPNIEYLSNGLDVWNLSLHSCAGIKSLPPDLKVNGAISLNGCENLNHTSRDGEYSDKTADLEIEDGDLRKTSTLALTEVLRNGMETFGAIDLRHSKKIEEFEFPGEGGPNVYKTLYFQGCISLKHLRVLNDARIEITVDLNLRDCCSLVEIPENLRVGRNLVLESCLNLSTLPESLYVGGDLTLINCDSLEKIPPTIEVKNQICVRDCSSLKSLPLEIADKFKGNLNGCTKLESIPNGLEFKMLMLKNCENLSRLPNDLKVDDDLLLVNCTKLTELPRVVRRADSSISVSSISCTGCSNLTILPLSMNLYSLNLSSCSSLTELPEELFVSQLNLSGCEKLKKMPKKLHVRSLIMSGCTSLKYLPENMKAERINASRCTELVSLPDGLQAFKIDLSQCSKLKALPENLSVRNDLILTRCEALEYIPASIRVEGDLVLTGCTSLRHLPNGLCVSHLYTSKCTSLLGLPEGLIAEQVEANDCTSLVTLPANIIVDNLLDLSGCTSIEKLPDILSVRNLIISGCSSLTGTVEQRLFVRGLHLDESPKLDFSRLESILCNKRLVVCRLDISDCPSLKKFPEIPDLVVSGYLKLKNCKNLVELPSEMCINGDIDLTGCSSLKKMPDLLKAKNLYLRNCENVQSLPKRLYVDDDLDISDCPRISELPQGLRVRNFKSSRCVALEQLPKNMDVYTLNLHACTGIRDLPDNLTIRGDTVGLEGCINITSLPDVSNWFRHRNHEGGSARTVDFFLQGIGLFREDLNHIVETGNIRIHYFSNGVMEEEWQARYKQKQGCPYLGLPTYRSNAITAETLSEYRTVFGDLIEDPVVLINKDSDNQGKVIEQGPFSYEEFMSNWLENGRGLYHNKPIPSILDGRLQRLDVSKLA